MRQAREREMALTGIGRGGARRRSIRPATTKAGCLSCFNSVSLEGSTDAGASDLTMNRNGASMINVSSAHGTSHIRAVWSLNNAGCYRCAKELPHRCAFMRDSASNSANAGSVPPHLEAGADHACLGSAVLQPCTFAAATTLIVVWMYYAAVD